MPELIEAGAPEFEKNCSEATCVHTRKIYDSCQAKDCLEDLRLYPTGPSQALIDNAVAVRSGRAELLYVDIRVQPVGLGKGFFEVNLNFFYRAVMELSCGTPRPMAVEGLAVFSKRSVLFGSEGTSKTFSSNRCCGPMATESSLPVAVCEAVDPIVLSTKLVDACDAPCGELSLPEVPEGVLEAFGENIVVNGNQGKRIYFTLGQFSILRLERDAQLLMPVYDYCMPDKECCLDKKEDDPCEIFQQVDFPVRDFFPPASTEGIDPVTRLRNGCCSR